MAWTAPNTYVAGAILTAAQMNAMQANALAGGPIYATEALRDAAITSPFEGQRAYITGSTVAAATGNKAATPTGIQTIYNGSKWVCVTPVGAYSDVSGTTATTGSYVTTLTGDGTEITATITTGTSALVMLTGTTYSSSPAATNVIAVAVSGATTVAASDATGGVGFQQTAGAVVNHCRSWTIVNLTAGTNVFTLSYKQASAGVTFYQRCLTVQGIA